jgi:hypothetical protein
VSTTNYYNTFIQVAPDCPTNTPEVPPVTATPTVAALQHRLIMERPYRLTSDDIIFGVVAIRADIPGSDLEAERARFFSKGQPCMRASVLSKRYGWGTHHDAQGRVALYGVGTPEYERLAADPQITQKLAMRSSRA